MKSLCTNGIGLLSLNVPLKLYGLNCLNTNVSTYLNTTYNVLNTIKVLTISCGQAIVLTSCPGLSAGQLPVAKQAVRH